MEAAGFIYRHAASLDMFLDGPDAKARDAVRIVFAGEEVRSESLLPSPLVGESELHNDLRIVTLESLVQMKLTSYRDKDRTHLRDMSGVGLIDASWLPKLPPELAARLQHVLDTPDG